MDEMDETVLDQVVKMCRGEVLTLEDLQQGLCSIADYLRVGTVLYDSKISVFSGDEDENVGKEYIKLIDKFLERKLRLIDDEIRGIK